MGFVDKAAFKYARATFFWKLGKSSNVFWLGFKNFFVGCPMVAGCGPQPLSYR